MLDRARVTIEGQDVRTTRQRLAHEKHRAAGADGQRVHAMAPPHDATIDFNFPCGVVRGN